MVRFAFSLYGNIQHSLTEQWALLLVEIYKMRLSKQFRRKALSNPLRRFTLSSNDGGIFINQLFVI